jgi:hypothetical protein
MQLSSMFFREKLQVEHNRRMMDHGRTKLAERGCDIAPCAATLITGARKGKVFRVSGVWYFQDLQGAIRAVGIDDFVIGQACHVGRL